MYITSRCVINYLELKNGRSKVTSVMQSSLKLHLNVYAYIIYLQMATKGNGYNVKNVEAVVTYKVE